jgi:hypothetical protein
MPTEEERKQESKDWNNWQPGSGRRGWSPWGQPITREVRDAETGHPIKDGQVDWKRVIDEANRNG